MDDGTHKWDGSAAARQRRSPTAKWLATRVYRASKVVFFCLALLNTIVDISRKEKEPIYEFLL